MSSLRPIPFGNPTADGSYVAMALDAVSYAQTVANIGVPFDGSAPFSVDAWVRFNGLPAMASVLSQSGVFSFGSSANTICFQFAGLPIVQSDPSQGELRDNSWHYVCATFDGGSIRLYIDGQFNTFQSVFGTVTPNTNPVLIGNGIQGIIRFARVYLTTLSADAVLANMFGTPDPSTITANFDFTQVPPVDRGPNAYPISLQNNAAMIRVSPALSLSSTGFAQPLLDEDDVNPGGMQTDPYTVQSWIFVQSTANSQQAIFVNSDLESDTGMALYLSYDATASGFRVVSQRGANIGGDSLTSTGVVTLGSWFNIATTYDGTTLKLYLNGALDSSKPSGPIALYRSTSDLLIGAALSQGVPTGASTLQGFLRRVDVWTRALTAAEITQYMSTLPDVEDPNLEGAYSFTTAPARNIVNGHPIGLAEGAVASGQLGPATISEPEFVPRDPPGYELEEATLASFRASLDFSGILDSHATDFQAAMDSDVALFTDERDKKLVSDAWSDALRRMREEPQTLPFTVTTHEIDGERFLVAHTPRKSYVAYRGRIEDDPACLVWKINLVFIVFGGFVSTVFGLNPRLSAQASAYIARILNTPRLAALLAYGRSITAAVLFKFIAVAYEYGFLRELLTMLVSLGFWSLVRFVARALAIAAGIGAADVIASLAATVVAFIAAYLQRPVSCDPLPTIDIAAIKFNYDPSGRSTDALAIRKNFANPVKVPEWVKGEVTASASPAAYAIAPITGKKVYVQAKFTISAPTSQAVQIRATGGGILGSIGPTTLTFSGGGTSTGWVLLELTNQTIAAGGIQRVDVSWVWQYQIGSSGWTTMATTNHRIYVVLDTPTLPWVQAATDTTQLPWTDVLDYSCAWASGQTTIDGAASAITSSVYNNLKLKYDNVNGASAYIETSTPGTIQFRCTQFIRFLTSGTGIGPLINCTDCATIVTTFANSVGCNLTQSTMYTIANGVLARFDCNEIIAIGLTGWGYPFAGQPWAGSFNYHEVAWTSGIGFPDPLYDACLQVDGGPYPWTWPGTTHTPTLPLKMQFTTKGISPTFPIVPPGTPFLDQSYRERLATDAAAGIGRCVPRGPFPNTQSGHRELI